MPDHPYRLSLIARARIWAAPQLLQLRDFCRECIQDIPLLTRIASHVGLLLLMVLTIAASGVQLSIVNGKGGPAASEEEEFDPIIIPDLVTSDALIPVPVPITTAPKRIRRDVIKYTVRSGDNLSSIAQEFEITGESVMWANPKLEDNPDMLSIGQVLNIPPVSGVLVTVQAGDTLKGLAEKYKSTKVKADALVQNIITFEFNQERHDLKEPDYALTAGQYLMIPNGYKPYIPRVVTAYSGPIPPSAAKGTGSFGWPVSGRITQGFKTYHRGLDIGAPTGTPVYAADSGYVVTAGWSNVGYGYMIMINHGNGYVTRYAHLSAFLVDVGESVKKGQMIGRVGSTGRSTGPHLHFEIIQGSGYRNPFLLLPGK